MTRMAHFSSVDCTCFNQQGEVNVKLFFFSFFLFFTFLAVFIEK